MIKKFTTGFVVQNFNEDGELIDQEFVSSDQVEWEDANGETIDDCDFYYPFDMK